LGSRKCQNNSSGGFAFVFLAEEVETKRLVALKRILVQDDEHVEIIKREISILVWSSPLSSSTLPLQPHSAGIDSHNQHALLFFDNTQKRLKGKEGIIPFLGAASFRKANRKEIVVLTEFCPRGSVLDLMHQVCAFVLKF